MHQISLIFFALFGFSQTLGAEFPEFPSGVFKIPSEGYSLYDAKTSSNVSTPLSGRFRFKVKASNDTIISFASNVENNDLEFIIGANGNMETHIQVNKTNYVTMKTPEILSKFEFQTFEINWHKNIFHFAQIDEKQGDMNNLMLFKSKSIFPINYIGLKTEPNGEWFIREREYPRNFTSYIKTVDKTALQIGNILRCMVVETKNQSRTVSVHTVSSPIEQKNYTYVEVPQRPEESCYNVFVRAKLDAHIALSSMSNNKTNAIVEFHLRPNTSFNITFDYKSNEIGNKFVPRLLSDQEYLGYWIEFNQNTGNLSIGKIGENYFMARNIEVFEIDYIGVLTSNGNEGDWMIKKYGSCPGNKNDDINTEQFWGDARTKCYIENLFN